ncbi:MAG: hypothetical protein ACLTWO_14710 [Blautia massiliensis (ex Durand et al. 2017)]
MIVHSPKRQRPNLAPTIAYRVANVKQKKTPPGRVPPGGVGRKFLPFLRFIFFARSPPRAALWGAVGAITTSMESHAAKLFHAGKIEPKDFRQSFVPLYTKSHPIPRLSPP